MEAQNNPDCNIVYEYGSLPNPPELNESLLNTLDTHIKGHWKDSQQCITMLRSVCKFYPQYIPDIFIKYGPAILDFFNHTTTTVLYKNVLNLLMEIFNCGVQVNVQGCIEAFLPHLLKKAAIDSCHATKEMCQKILTTIAGKCCYCNTIEIATKTSCLDKNNQIRELSIKLLAGILGSISNSITQINPNTLQVIMRGMHHLITQKKNIMKNSALDVCVFIFNNIGAENYLQLMNYALEPQKAEEMRQAMETHRTQKIKQPQLSEVIKHQKMTNNRESGVWSQNLRM